MEGEREAQSVLTTRRLEVSGVGAMLAWLWRTAGAVADYDDDRKEESAARKTMGREKVEVCCFPKIPE